MYQDIYEIFDAVIEKEGKAEATEDHNERDIFYLVEGLKIGKQLIAAVEDINRTEIPSEKFEELIKIFKGVIEPEEFEEILNTELTSIRKMNEEIIVVSRDRLFNNEKLAFQGVIITDDSPEKTTEIIQNLSEWHSTARRGDAEGDTSLKQPIPYCVVRKGDKVFMYERLVGGGETRLHNKLSIGVGGHMNDALNFEDSFSDILNDNLQRELNEELVINSSQQNVEIVGLINDDNDKVGQVHIGILVIIDIDEEATVEVNEPEQLVGKWMSVNDLLEKETYKRLETWSKIVLDSVLN